MRSLLSMRWNVAAYAASELIAASREVLPRATPFSLYHVNTLHVPFQASIHLNNTFSRMRLPECPKR